MKCDSKKRASEIIKNFLVTECKSGMGGVRSGSEKAFNTLQKTEKVGENILSFFFGVEFQQQSHSFELFFCGRKLLYKHFLVLFR